MQSKQISNLKRENEEGREENYNNNKKKKIMSDTIKREKTKQKSSSRWIHRVGSVNPHNFCTVVHENKTGSISVKKSGG